ncbi:hypothetical protein GOBAR_AA22993 [Gossypium barbadense]|uniref:EGF-like domain-containing protein n=1 Tax=Gossypium barbadense TaxID=3634 RepID=A0A2P5X2X7_GOSBA|nr:hypothetical protein GOBAR_AA22993 [Gossypium barbadense]
MDNRSLHLTLFSFLFLLFFYLATSTTVTTTSSHVTLNPLQGVFCSVIDCGQGTCQASNNSLLGFDCLCKPGWKKIQIGPFTFPSCLVPNYWWLIFIQAPTQGIKEGALLLTDCDLVWCGDGECVSNGTGYICQCHQNSENLFNSSGLACFKPCYFGADCQGLGLKFPSGNPPPPPPSSNSPTSYGNGLKGVSSCSGTLYALTVIVLVLIKARLKDFVEPFRQWHHLNFLIQTNMCHEKCNVGLQLLAFLELPRMLFPRTLSRHNSTCPATVPLSVFIYLRDPIGNPIPKSIARGFGTLQRMPTSQTSHVDKE